MSGLNRDDVLRMAREAGFGSNSLGVTFTSGYLDDHLERFANLVAAAEREACAALCKGLTAWHSEIVTAAYENAADNIRARGNDAA